MCDDVSANKSLYGNEHETPSTRSQLRTHAWRLSVMAWVARGQGKPIPSGVALWSALAAVRAVRDGAPAPARSEASTPGGSGTATAAGSGTATAAGSGEIDGIFTPAATGLLRGSSPGS
jgi:hypothetical protein